MTDLDRAGLEQQGLKLLSYLGNNCYFAAAGPAAAVQTLADGGLLADVAAPKREWKTHPAFSAGPVPEWAYVPAAAGQAPAQAPNAPAVTTEDPPSRVAAYVLFHPDVKLTPDAEAICAAHGATIRSRIVSVNALVIELDLAAIPALADEDAVQWIEPPLPRLRDINDGVRHIAQANSTQSAPYGLTGSGVTVLLYDGGTAWASHKDFGDRVHVRDGSGLNYHATHVAGTIGGSGSESGGGYRGVAPGVTIESYGFEYDGSGTFLYTNPGDLEADYGQAMNAYGAVIANNSIGTNLASNGFPCEYEGDYGLTSMLIDAIVGGSLGSPMRVVWANGNERGSGRCGTTYRTTAPPACAKNPIMVGAVNSNDDTMTWFSSWGPTDDGRLKPELCAAGCQSGGDSGVTSTAIGSGYLTLCGTSMACPAVTGMGALLLQQWSQLNPGSPLPRNATLKAVLVQSAMDLGAIGPDYQTGYGSARVREAVDLLRAGQVRESDIAQGQVRTFVVRVAPGTRSLKATLAWDDPPAAPNVTAYLVNDLDIVALPPSGTSVDHPWTLDPDSPELPAVRTRPDRLNNLEQVVVDYPVAGNWTIRVSGYSVPFGPQAFSVATSSNVVACSRAGTVLLGGASLACGSSAAVTVNDCDLNSNTGAIETAVVRVKSGTDPTGIDVLLTETGPDTATFSGTFELSESADPGQPGVLRVADGDSIVALYEDADNGAGVTVQVTASATADCVAPTISGVTVSSVEARRGVVTFTTSEPTQGRVRFGTECGLLDKVADVGGLRTAHEVVLSHLTPAATYWFAVEVRDQAGLVTVDDNGGQCYSLITLDAPDYYTQQPAVEGTAPDHRSITFTPDGSIDFYSACVEPIDQLPVNPDGGTWIRNGGEVVLSGGARVSLYGQSYDRLMVTPWGTINFGGWGSEQQTFANHFAMPRISALLDWFYPVEKGRLSYKQLSDRFVLTGEGLWDAATQRPNTFQAEMFFDGRIRLSWLEFNAYRAIIGLSRGGGTPADFAESNLAGLSVCVADPLGVDPTGPLSAHGVQGGPFVPTCTSYQLTNTSDPPAAIEWSAVASEAWITVAPAGGTLSGGGTAEVQVCIGSAAGQLPARDTEYSGQVRFTNVGTGAVRVREVRLAVMEPVPPVANSVLATTAADTPVDVTLVAEQNGEPVPPGWLTYSLVVAPEHGQLSGVGDGNVWTYQPAPGFTGVDRFTYQASNSGQPPGVGTSNEAEVIVRVVAPPIAGGLPDPPDGAAGVPVDTAVLAAGAAGPSLMRSAIVAASSSLGVTNSFFTDPRDKLMSTGLFHQVDIVDAGEATPRLSELRMYDSVIVWSNNQFDDPTTLGDRLADYVNGGGGVVVAVFANTSVLSFGNLLGRFATQNYYAMDYPTANHAGAMLDGPQLLLGDVFDRFHATLAGVHHFDGGYRSFRAYSSYLAPTARFVATWSDGAPLVAVRDIAGTPRVDLGLFPVSSDAEYGFWESATDGARLLGNSLFLTGKRNGAATTYDMYFGTDNPPAIAVARDLPAPSCPMPGPLDYATTYYWRIVAKNAAGSSESPVYAFSTPPTAQASIGDSIPETHDRLMPFGERALGQSSSGQVTICNSDPAEDLLVSGLSLQQYRLHVEDFNSGTAGNWQPTRPAVWTVTGGAYRASGTTPGEYLQSTYAREPIRDAWVRFKLRRTVGPSWAAALALRASDDFKWGPSATGSAYLIGLSGSSSFYVGRYLNGQFQLIQPWSYSEALKQLAGVNDVTVNMVGSAIAVYFNGVLAWSGQDESIALAGRFALMGYAGNAGADAAYIFDDFEIGPPLPVSAGAPTAGLLVLDVGGGTPTRAPVDPNSPEGLEVPPKIAQGVTSELGMPIDWTPGFTVYPSPDAPMALAPGACTVVPVAFAPEFAGAHQSELVIESNDATSRRISVELTGWGGIRSLSVTPEVRQIFAGPVGGPMSPEAVRYTLTNRSDAPVAWTAEVNVNWLTITPADGTIAPLGTVEVDVSTNAQANTLLTGNWAGLVTFHEAGSTLDYQREVELQVCGLPQVPANPMPADGAVAIAFDTSLKWNIGVNDPQVWESFGEAKIGYTSWDQVIADVVTVAARQTLLEFRMPLVVPGSADLYFVVGEAAAKAGPFTLSMVRRVHVEGLGEQHYSSGPMHATLEPGRFYAIGVAWGPEEIGFSLEYRPGPVEWSLGTVEGLLYDYSASPVAGPLSRFADVALCPMQLSVVKGGAVTYDVYLGRSDGTTARVCEDVAEPTCSPPQPLDYNTQYLWQVIAFSPCGQTEGLTWSFATGSCVQYPVTIDHRAGRRPALRRVHGPAGAMDLDLLTPAEGYAAPVEPRESEAAQIIVRFTRPVQGVGGLDASDVRLVSSLGEFAPITGLQIAGDQLTIDLGLLANGRYTLSLPGIADASDPTCLVADTLCFVVLAGDVSGDGVVNTSDFVSARAWLSGPVDAESFTADVNTDGLVDMLDFVAIREHIGNLAPGPCP